jgi:hypothetical protein
LAGVLGDVVYKQALPFGTNWGNHGSEPTQGVCTYSRFGRLVVVQGLATKSGTPGSGDVIGTLPTGFRPSGLLHFPVATGATDAYGRVAIDSSGVIRWEAGNTTETDYTSLSGIVFIAA